MSLDAMRSEFPELNDENRRIWNANATWWDDRIGDGNAFQTLLIEPATERLLEVGPSDLILDAACGAGRFARRMAALGARVVAFDYSDKFIERARARTAAGTAVDYYVANASDEETLLSLGLARFNKAVCTMAIMDMPQIRPLLSAVAKMLKPGGTFVFSLLHPCFHMAAMQRFAEISEDEAGRHQIRTGVKISSYLTPSARKTEGIIGQPEPQYLYHRSIQTLFRSCFEAGFVVNGLEEPGLAPGETAEAGVRWRDMPEIPPIMVVRAKTAGTPST